MSKQALIYDRPRVVSRAAHAGVSVMERKGFEFARSLNAVPLTTPEFAIAAREFPIVFTEAGGVYTPAVLLGVRNDENLFVGDDAEWLGRYLPAFLRRYPFVFTHDETAKTYTLCIDEASDRVNRDGVGRRLFEESGEPTPFLKRMGDFVKEWERAFQASRAFCKRLSDLRLFNSRELNFKLPDGPKAVTRGFSTVDRERLRTLDGDAVKELLANGDLELIHAHLLSLGCVDDLAKRVKSEDRVLN